MEASSTISQLNSMHTSAPSRSLRQKERAENAPVPTKVSQNAEALERTDRFERSRPQGLPQDRELNVVDPREKLLPDNAESLEETAETEESNPLGDFNIDEFNNKIRQQLLDQITESKKILKESGVDIQWASDILYPVDEEVEAAEVPEEWNAENTSQRIVDFALSFREVANKQGLSDEEFISQIKEAVADGFRLAKKDLGSIPEASARLFNDTFEQSMKKLDDALLSWQEDDSQSAVAVNTKAMSYVS